MIVYTVLGLYPILRRELNNHFKRLGFKDLKEKRWFLSNVLGYSPFFSEMTINELKKVIEALSKYKRFQTKK
ncbi:hypothetical protein ACTHPT_14715 [Bacillus altitudinis]|uniref:hypothetical protein n=1 Tax=Bacillus altitudinis TaxID=293387 RepID=UPI003F7C82AD